MLKTIKDSEIHSLSYVRSLYPNCKILMSDVDSSKMPHTVGKIYAISTDAESMNELFALDRQLREKKVETLVIGSYTEGGFVGVQHFADQ